MLKKFSGLAVSQEANYGFIKMERTQATVTQG